MKYVPIIAVLSGLSLIAGCTIVDPYSGTSEIPGDGDALIQTHLNEYTVTREADWLQLAINYTFTNHVGQTVSVGTCQIPHPPSLEKLIQNEWVTVYSPVVKRCAGAPLVIQPGQTWDGTFYLHSTSRPDTSPRLEVDSIPGTYRLIWAIHRGPDPYPVRTSVPSERVVSNPFTIAE